MNIHEWIQYGIDRGYCTPTACNTHDGPEMTAEEADAFEEGYDPCIHVVRLWEQP